MNRVAIFLSPSHLFQRLFSAANELDLDVLNVVSSNVDSSLPGKSIPVSTWNFDEVLSAVERNLAGRTPVFIVTLLDRLAFLAVKLNVHFGTAQFISDEKVLQRTRNKAAMRQFLSSTDLNPSFALIRSPDELPNVLSKERFVIKPAIGWSSIGVEVVNGTKALPDAFNRTKGTLSFLVNACPVFPDEWREFGSIVMVEKFIAGPEYSVDLFVNDGNISVLGICEKTPMTPPFFEEISYSMPANISEAQSNLIRSAAITAVQALQIKWGVIHLEGILSKDGFKLLEVNQRIGGSGLTHDLANISSGIDLGKALLKQILGQSPQHELAIKQHDIALLYLYQVSSGGTVRSLPTPPAKLDGCELVRSFNMASPGNRLASYPNYSGLPGFALYRSSGRHTNSWDNVACCLRSLIRKQRILYEE